MKKKVWVMLCLILCFLCSLQCATQEKKLTKLWESESSLNQPDSIVFDPIEKVLYVSSINGEMLERNRLGYISKLGIDGVIIEKRWIDKLHAPKGIALYKNHLYITDINSILVVDITTKKVLHTYIIRGAKFLNDIVVDEKENVYVSDMLKNIIYKLSNGQVSVWLENDDLECPNGLCLEDDSLVVGTWGNIVRGYRTPIPGKLKRISFATKKITDICSQHHSIGNLDGVEPAGNNSFFVTDWVKGNVYYITTDNHISLLATIEQGISDHKYIQEQQMLIVPLMNSNKLIAYRVSDGEKNSPRSTDHGEKLET